MEDIKGRKQMCDSVWPHSVAHVRLDMVNCSSAASWESHWRLEDSFRNQYAKYSKDVILQTGSLPWLLLCWWGLLQGARLHLQVLFPARSSVAYVIQLAMMLHWFLWSGYTNRSETAQLVSCQPPNNHQLGLQDKASLEQSIFVWYAKKSILSFLMTQCPELHPAPPSKVKQNEKKDQKALMPSARDYLINSFEVFILNLPHGIVSESNTTESEYQANIQE